MPSATGAQPLEAARDAVSQGSWASAREAFARADPSGLTAGDLVGWGDAAWWSGHAEEAQGLRERAYTALVDSGDVRRAARLAVLMAWDHAARGVMAVYHGWMAKAERLLADEHGSAEYAYLVTVRGFTNLDLGNVAEALPDLELGEELGTRTGDREVTAIARVARGRLLVGAGRVDEGLALLDEVTASAVSGELRPFEAGLVYCVTISACQQVGDLRRAAEWTEAANRWCDRNDTRGFPGACRVHRAQVLQMRGQWQDAEVQCEEACEELADYNVWITAEGRYEIGEIRRRRGEFAAALEAYRQAGEIGLEPQPGLALLRLAEGRVDAAVAALRRALEEGGEPLRRVALLPAQVEVSLAAGDLGAAREAAAELARTVTTYTIGSVPAPAFEAQRHLAEGRIHLAERDWRAAVDSLRLARARFQQVGAPYEVAQVRMLLGLAYRQQGDEDGATDELEAVQATFERLGARLDEERAKELLGRRETRRTFLFTDIVGSTRLVESLGDDRWRRLLARHDELLRERILDAGGEVIKQTGDGFFAAFGQPGAALRAAVAIQRALAEEVVAPDVRIGVHTGGAFHPEGGSVDYAGQGVHMAARIGSAAGAGEILVSAPTLEGVPGTGARSAPREIALKGFSAPVAVISVGWR